MKFYKRSLLIFMFIFLLSFSFVWADELNETNTTLNSENGINGTFTELNTEISLADNELNISRDYVFNIEVDSNFTKGMQIYKKDLVINGNNHYIDARGQASIFDIFDSGITINNLTFKNAKNHAIYANYTDITANNIIFINNTGENGAGICGYQCDLICTNNIFINNFANKGAAISMNDESNLNLVNASFKNDNELYFGLIYGSKSQITILNTSFVNITSRYCPAIYGDYLVELKIKNSKFNNLFSNITAGAIALNFFEKESVIENCSFINVSSQRNGGAIFCEVVGSAELSPLTVRDSQFINCSSEFGGAILSLGGFLNIDRSNFTSNHAKYHGGAVYINNAYRISITDSYFFNNTLENLTEELNHGCAIYGDCVPENFNIINSNFTNNYLKHAEAIYLYDSIYKISDSYFKGNGMNIYTVFDKENSVETKNNYVDGANKLNQKDYIWFTYGNNTPIEFNPIIIDESYIYSSYFNLGDFGIQAQIQNQMGTENCWAFGTSTVLKLALLKQTNLSLNSSFSINNIAFYAKHYSIFGENSEFVDGGDSFSAAYYFLSWLGGYLHEDNSNFDEIGRISITENGDKFHVHNFIAFPKIDDIKGNLTVYKEALVKYGALAVTVNAPNSLIKDDYNNDTHGSYYYIKPDEFSDGDSNHIVVLVGWDDNYSKDNFLVTPPGNGAWILQNSWGEEWGDNGYYYVSYYDTAFATLNSPITFIIDENYPYTKNYQYDFDIMEFDYEFTEEGKAFANVYESDGDDLIAAVGTYFNEANADYTIVISVNGNEIYSQSGKSLFRGFQTIILDKTIAINKGDKFRVEIKSKFIPEYHYSREIIPSGVSFVDYGDGFEDISESGHFVSIKAYTIPNFIKTNNSTKYYGNEEPFIIIAEPNKDITFEINGIKATVKSDENGTAKIGVNLNPGKYPITIEYNGTKIVYLIEIKTTIISLDVTRGYNSNYNYKIQLLNSTGEAVKNTAVEVTVNGKINKYTTDSNGFITIPFTKLTANQIIRVVNPTNNEISTKTIKVVSRFSENKNINMYYFDGSKFTVKVYGDDGKLVGANQVVTINLNKKTYKVKTNKNGVATLKIPKTVVPGTYKLTATYKGQTIKNTIKVKQVLAVKKTVKVKKSARKLVLKAKVKNGKTPLKKKIVKFKIKGKTYKSKTNKKGIVKVTIKKNVLKKLKKGKKYTVKVTYLKDTVKSTVKVK